MYFCLVNPCGMILSEIKHCIDRSDEPHSPFPHHPLTHSLTYFVHPLHPLMAKPASQSSQSALVKFPTQAVHSFDFTFLGLDVDSHFPHSFSLADDLLSDSPYWNSLTLDLILPSRTT